MYNRNQALATNTNFLGQNITKFNNLQFGGSMGGALVKDRLHYFVAYDRQQVAEPFSTLQVETNADWARVQGTAEGDLTTPTTADTTAPSGADARKEA